MKKVQSQVILAAVLNQFIFVQLLFGFPGSLGFAPIFELAEKETLKEEFLAFPGDESPILALCLDPSERFVFVAKSSNKLYSIDLAVDGGTTKRPFISKIVQLESEAIQISSSKDFGLWILLENGKILNFNSPQLQEGKFEIPVKESIGCISQVKENVMALGSKKSSDIYLIYFNSEIEVEEISVPFDDLDCGSIGISSIFLLPNGNSLLFACKPDNAEVDDVPLLLLENILAGVDGEGLKFSFYFDPCASRPPRTNQFYFLNAGKWSSNLVDFVVLGNYASPDIGICGRTSFNGEFEAFFIDNDEGLAQLPFINGEVTFPVGMALDFSSKVPLEDLNDPDAENFAPAPILWVLTNSGHLCPFSMLKTDLDEPLNFMKNVPILKFDDSKDQTLNISVSPISVPATPQTPSKVPLQQLASLQKSTEIKPLESPSFKPAPVVNEGKKVDPVALPVKLVSSAAPVVYVEEPAPVVMRKEEKMESLTVGQYQSILLSEIAATHFAMQEDIFALKQLSLKNSLLLRQNSQKYFNSLGSLENYAESLEKLLKSSENVFAGIKDKVEALKFGLNELMGKAQQVRGNWNRIKQDRKINWDSRVKSLTTISEDLFERIDRLRNFLSNPAEALKYRATLKSFVDSTQEKIQLLMAQLSGLFVVSQNDEISGVFADLGALNLNSGAPSCDNLLYQLNDLSLVGSEGPIIKTEKRNRSLLNAVKLRGSRLQIPPRISSSTSSSSAQTEKALKLSAEDESLISSFVSAIKLTDEVPEFAEISVLSKLSLNEESKPTAVKPAHAKTSDTKSAFNFDSSKPQDYKPSASFSFPSASKSTESPKPAEDHKSSFIFSLPIDSKVAELKSETKLIDTSVSKPINARPFDTKTKTADSNTVAFNPVSSSVSFAPISPNVKSNEPTTTSFSFNQPADSEPVSKISTSSVPSSAGTKIPSIFTVSTTPTEDTAVSAERISVLKQESPLPTFNSLDFGSKPATESTEIKPFPSIFGVKPTANVEKDRLGSVELKSPQGEVKHTEGIEKETSFPIASPSGFTFAFKPSEPAFKKATAESALKDAETKPIVQPASTAEAPQSITSPQSTSQSKTLTVPQSQTSAPQLFSFSFAPNSSTAASPSAGFSITAKPSFPNPASTAPVFGSTSVPTFGATSLPTAQTVSLAPAFGQTSLSSNGGFGAFSSNNESGFAAFAASSTNTGFSSFASINSNDNNNNNGNSLTFASFLPADKKQHESPNNNNSQKTSSPFSFTGFRE